jgi:hypothetical protein
MMLLTGLDAIATNLGNLSTVFPHISLDGMFLAQQVSDPNVIGQMQDAFNNFIASGQVWALIIGFIIGYVVRGMTAG